MKPRRIRQLVVVVFVVGVAGMIGGSIADNNGLAITFGLITAMAAVGLILVTAVAGPSAFEVDVVDPSNRGTEEPDLEAAGGELEGLVQELVSAGSNEAAVRALVRRAVSFGRRQT